MSGGQKQRLALAGAVIQEPELLFLDEPTSAVDPESRRDFWEKLFDLADAGTTILVSTHYMDEAERCHRIAILDRGALVADGTPDELTRALAGRTLEVTRAAAASSAQSDAVERARRAERGPDRQHPARAQRSATDDAEARRASMRSPLPGWRPRSIEVASEPGGRVRLRHPRRKRAATCGARRMKPAPAIRDRAQGVAADAPRPHHPGDDRRHPGRCSWCCSVMRST